MRIEVGEKRGGYLHPSVFMWIFLYIYFIICSFLVIPGIKEEFWMPKNAVFVTGGLILLSWNFMVTENNIIKFSNKWAMALVIYISVVFGYFFFIPIIFNNSLGKVTWNVWNFLPTINTIIAVFLIKFLVESTVSFRPWVDFAKVACWCMAIFSFVVITQYFGIDPFYTEANGWYIQKGRWDGIPKNATIVTFLGNDFLSANYIAVLAPLCLIFQQLRYKIFLALAIISLVLIKSITGILALSFGCLVYFGLTNQYWKFFLGLAALILLGVWSFIRHPEFLSSTGRLEVWPDFIKASFDNIYTGHGLGSFMMMKYKNLAGKTYLSAHNELIQIFYEGGIILVGIVMGYFIDFAKRVVFSKPTILSVGYLSALASYLVFCMTGFPLHIASLALIGILLIASLEAQIRGEKYV